MDLEPVARWIWSRHPCEPGADDRVERSPTLEPDGGPVDRLGVEWRGTRPQQIMPLSAGTRLGHYDVTALLGEGGMGEVYRVRDGDRWPGGEPSTGRSVPLGR